MNINGIQLTANEWKKNNQHRIYFTSGTGQACWDVKKSEWIKVHKEFGFRFKALIKENFKLK